VHVARPQRLERLAEENRSGSCAPDPVARKHSLAEPIYHVCRAQPVERLAEEVELEIRSPRDRAREQALTQAKTFELSLADLTLAQMGFQRDPLREPDVRLEEIREIRPSVLAVHGIGTPNSSTYG